MEMEYAIQLKNVTKHFVRTDSPFHRLGLIFKNLFVSDDGNRRDEKNGSFFALRNINLEISKGESFGILGRNGAGKSTLLQIIAKTLFPSSGEVSVKGNVNALLELGSGFNPEFTGRENVYLNGTVLGFSKAEIRERFDEILNFSEIGEFIDQPVKHYSSGMLIRLAFSVQAMLEPDILIVDEALAVGDIFFVQKCHDKIEQLLKNKKTTFVFVTHDLLSIQKYCHRVMVLNKGEPVFIGDPIQAIYTFQNLENKRNDLSKTGESREDVSLANEIVDQIQIVGPSDIVKLTHLRISDSRNEETTVFHTGDDLSIEYTLELLSDIDTPIVGIEIVNSRNILINSNNNFIADQTLELPSKLPKGRKIEVRQSINLPVEPGQYLISLGLNMVQPEKYINKNQLSQVEINLAYQTAVRFINLPPITVLIPRAKHHSSFYGLVELKNNFEISVT